MPRESAARKGAWNKAQGSSRPPPAFLCFLDWFGPVLAPILTGNCLDWPLGGEMADLLYMGLTLLFLALTLALIEVCARLMEDKS